MSDDHELVFVQHFKRAVVDDSNVAIFVVPAGRYSYVTTLGARKTIRSYDYGETPSADEVEKLKAEAKQRSENYQKAMAVQKAADDLAKAKKDEQGKTAAIKFLKEKAAEGAPMSQYRLAEKYLKGDGVPMDIEQAKFWLQCSCTNGYAEASNLLQKIQREQLTAKP
jgi:TPR repeat protein